MLTLSVWLPNIAHVYMSISSSKSGEFSTIISSNQLSKPFRLHSKSFLYLGDSYVGLLTVSKSSCTILSFVLVFLSCMFPCTVSALSTSPKVHSSDQACLCSVLSIVFSLNVIDGLCHFQNICGSTPVSQFTQFTCHLSCLCAQILTPGY